MLLLWLGLHSWASAERDRDYQVCEEYRRLDQELRQTNGGNLGSGCGPRGYLIDYGYHYCKKFVDHADSFTPAGQETMRAIRECLVRALEQPGEFSANPEKPSLSCANARSIGISSHYPCYMHSGYCQMPIQDHVQLMILFKAEAARPFAWTEFLGMFQGCRRGGN